MKEREAVEQEFRKYFAECRGRIQGLTESEFSWLGTWNSKRRGLLQDLFIVSINVILAVPAVFVRRAVTFFDRNGYQMITRYLRKVPTGIRTRYQVTVEKRIWTSLLGFAEFPKNKADREKALNEIIERDFAPGLQGLHLGSKLSPIVELELEEFFSKRAYISDLMSAAVTWGTAWYLFHDSSLGIFEIGKKLARRFARRKAESHFFLGPSLGHAYYNMVPVKTPKSQIYWGSLAILVSLTALAIIASYLSEPIQGYLGIQKRQLNQLLDTLENNVLLEIMRIYAETEGAQKIP